jgi:protein-disulfide isomerase
MPAMTEENLDTLTLKINRSQLIVIALPIVFLLGLAVGFVLWGRAPAIADDIAIPALAEDVSSNDSSDAQPVAQSGDQEVSAPQSVAEQIEALERYVLPVGEFDPFLGPEDALVTIVEFSDFECPFCQRHFQQVFPRLQSEYGDQVRFVYRDFPLNSIHPNAAPAAEAALCALEQDAFWPYHDLLFGGTLELNRASYESYAASLGMDVDAFIVCLDDGRYTEEVERDLEVGIETGVSSTPTFFINGIGLVGAQPFEVFQQIIDYELERLAAE